MDQENCAMARKNTECLAGKCRLVHGAIWSAAGDVTYSGEEEQGFTIGRSDGNVRTVNSITMASLAEQHGLRRISYVKMDIEGAEREVLSGDTLWLNMVQSIKIETHLSDATFYLEKLRKHGFVAEKDKRHWSAVWGFKSR
jgi:FkbM family methyltransferase